ncbi:hypothetical protein [Spirosoma litoris]
MFDFLEKSQTSLTITALNGNYAAFTIAFIISLVFLIYIGESLVYRLFIPVSLFLFLLLVKYFLHLNGLILYSVAIAVSFTITLLYLNFEIIYEDYSWKHFLRAGVLFIVTATSIIFFFNDLVSNYILLIIAIILAYFFLFFMNGFPVYRTILATSVLFFGLWISFSGVFNGIYSYLSAQSIEDWFKNEISSGLLTLRISSLVILFDLIRFLFSEIFNLQIMFYWLGLKFVRRDKLHIGVNVFSYMNYSTVYFAQIGFYVLTMLVLWHFAKISYQSVIVNLLNWALFFIIDDWTIIYNYSKTFRGVRLIDKRKVEFFNVLMVIMALITLYESKSWDYISIYAIVAFALTEQKINNVYKIESI